VRVSEKQNKNEKNEKMITREKNGIRELEHGSIPEP
jgi:hypothetical protein